MSPLRSRWNTWASGCLTGSARKVNGCAGRSVSIVPTPSVPVTSSWSTIVSSVIERSWSTIVSPVMPARSAAAA